MMDSVLLFILWTLAAVLLGRSYGATRIVYLVNITCHSKDGNETPPRSLFQKAAEII